MVSNKAWNLSDLLSDLKTESETNLALITVSSLLFTELGISHLIAGGITTLSGVNNNIGTAFNALMPEANHDFTLDEYPIDTKRILL